MLEIELKFRVEDWSSTLAKLRQLGGQLLETREEADHYYNAPDRHYRETDEVLRLRCVNDTAVFTYKGPKRAGTAKTREEIEVPLAVGQQSIEDAKRMLVALRYKPVTVVHKTRTVYTLPREGFELHICLDDLHHVGKFVEVEIVAEEAQLAKADSLVRAFADELRLTTPEPRAYLRMVLEKEGNE